MNLGLRISSGQATAAEAPPRKACAILARLSLTWEVLPCDTVSPLPLRTPEARAMSYARASEVPLKARWREEARNGGAHNAGSAPASRVGSTQQRHSGSSVAAVKSATS